MSYLIKEEKRTLRVELLEKRRLIEQERRHQAESEALDALLAIVRRYPFVMSYESFNDEMSTKGLNHILEEEGKLILPRVEGLELKPFHVADRTADLEISSFGILEPKTTCRSIDPREIGIVLVPGLGFDTLKHRIGYGMGHYDRFLKCLHEEAITLGVGFREQFLHKLLPVEETDHILTAVLLF